MCAKHIKFLMTRLSVCGLGVSCNEMNDTPMLLVVTQSAYSFNGTPVIKLQPIVISILGHVFSIVSCLHFYVY